MIDARITYDDMHVSEVYETTTVYFMIDKSLLEELRPGQYPDAEHGDISVEFPTSHPTANMTTVMISPTKDSTDYDWTDIDLPYEVIDELMASVELIMKG